MLASPALAALRHATAADHDALEAEARIEERLTDLRSRADAVAAFHRFHVAVEALAHPLVVGLGSFELLSRAEGIVRDLTSLGRTPEAGPLPEPPRSAGVAMGWVYVAEGSMLGGRILRRRITAAGSDMKGLSFLDPYGEETGARWRAFIGHMEDAVAEGRIRIDDLTQGGVEGFAHARRTLHPQAVALAE